MTFTRAFAMTALCSFLLCVGGNPSHGQGGALRFPESRSLSPGKLWLAWTSAERDGFVRGFIVGHGVGFKDGCGATETSRTDARKNVSQFDPCLQQEHLFKNEVPFYEEFITEFYTRFEMDRDVPFRVLLLYAEEKSPEKMHEWLSKGSE